MDTVLLKVCVCCKYVNEGGNMMMLHSFIRFFDQNHSFVAKAKAAAAF